MGEDVWYASYGSNMWWERFRCYLEGGVPPGATSTHVHAGARDSSPPTDARLVRLPYRMYFARSAPGWDGGGVSFLEHERVRPSEGAWGRAWQITLEQFDDVVAQENGMSPGDLSIDLSGLGPGDTQALNDRWYGRLVLVDHVDGLPMVTFTSPAPLDPAALNAPSEAYLRTLRHGLLESSDLDPGTVDAYLAACQGAHDRRA